MSDKIDWFEKAQLDLFGAKTNTGRPRRGKGKRTSPGQLDLFGARKKTKKRSGGPYIGPRGGKWADPQHKIPWKEDKPEKTKKPEPKPIKPQSPKIRFRKEGLGRQATYRSEDGRIEISFAFVGNNKGYYKDPNNLPHQRTKSLAWDTVIYGPGGDVIKRLPPHKTVAQAKKYASEEQQAVEAEKTKKPEPKAETREATFSDHIKIRLAFRAAQERGAKFTDSWEPGDGQNRQAYRATDADWDILRQVLTEQEDKATGTMKRVYAAALGRIPARPLSAQDREERKKQRAEFKTAVSDLKAEGWGELEWDDVRSYREKSKSRPRKVFRSPDGSVLVLNWNRQRWTVHTEDQLDGGRLPATNSKAEKNAGAYKDQSPKEAVKAALELAKEEKPVPAKIQASVFPKGSMTKNKRADLLEAVRLYGEDVRGDGGTPNLDRAYQEIANLIPESPTQVAAKVFERHMISKEFASFREEFSDVSMKGGSLVLDGRYLGASWHENDEDDSHREGDTEAAIYSAAASLGGEVERLTVTVARGDLHSAGNPHNQEKISLRIAFPVDRDKLIRKLIPEADVRAAMELAKEIETDRISTGESG